MARRWQDFLTLTPALTERWQGIGVDFRGHGQSDRAPSYLVADHTQDALAVFDTHVEQPAMLFGHSLGALVALAVAAARPEQVRAVVLEEPPAPAFLAGLPATPYFALFRALRSLAKAFRADTP